WQFLHTVVACNNPGRGVPVPPGRRRPPEVWRRPGTGRRCSECARARQALDTRDQPRARRPRTMTAQQPTDVTPIDDWNHLLDGRVAVVTGGGAGIGAAV